MIYRLTEIECRNYDLARSREWILTNNQGGFAMGTVAGICSRRYHGLLVAATDPPATRVALWKTADIDVKVEGRTYSISTNEYPGVVHPTGYQNLISFEVSPHEATWRYRLGKHVIAKSIRLSQNHNQAFLTLVNESNVPAEVFVRPIMVDRSYHENFHRSPDFPARLEYGTDQTLIAGDHESIIYHEGFLREPVEQWYYRFEHFRERERGLDDREDAFCACQLRAVISSGESLTCSVGTGAGSGASSEPDSTTVPPARGIVSIRQSLTESVAKNVITGAPRPTILAGYPWFTDWGRDTMISLPGALLIPHRFDEARRILRAFAGQMRDGLIPNRFVEAGAEPEYHTVDGTLWFVNAVYKTLQAEWVDDFAAEMMPHLHQVYRHHVKGTRFGIRVDAEDGLLTQGVEGAQLTWMDAKIGDWVVTPRHGKPVEINALWINALRVMGWLSHRVEGFAPEPFELAADRATESFNRKFWHSRSGYYLDTVDPDDASLRPNQVIAMAVPFSPCLAEHAVKALDRVDMELLTPCGLRTLAPSDPRYTGRFEGDMASRDAAYHQGTVWPWLLGSYATAVVKYRGDTAGARNALRASKEMLKEYGLGGIAEVYDGEMPQRAGGCPWQAWSSAEILRAWVEDIGGE